MEFFIVEKERPVHSHDSLTVTVVNLIVQMGEMVLSLGNLLHLHLHLSSYLSKPIQHLDKALQGASTLGIGWLRLKYGDLLLYIAPCIAM